MGRAIRTSHYRFVYWTNKAGEAVQVELYDHGNDPGENVNVAADRPEIVQRLIRQLRQFDVQ
jgi:hypothetical protein